MNPIGIMQGRLSPPARGRLQSFPHESWQHEFGIAASLGLDCIEWIYEFDAAAGNPIGSAAGLDAIRSTREASGVAVISMCADYFMERRLLTDAGEPDPGAVEHLRWLIERAALVGCRHIVLPFVDSSSLARPGHAMALPRLLTTVLPIARTHAVELHLETDLEPQELAAMLQAIADRTVRVTLDTGNSAALGFDALAEMRAIGRLVGSVHLKDRVRGGGTVPLGQGAADLETYVRLLSAAGFNGPYILQVARGRTGDEAAWTRSNLEHVARLMAQAGAAPRTA